MKKISRTAAAAFVSFGLIGTFALPAYANPASVEEQFQSQAPQTMLTADAPEAMLKADVLKATEDPDVVAAERREVALEQVSRDEADAQRIRDEQNALEVPQEATEPAGPSAADVAAGASAGGISGAALAQLGVTQDCTDLVQNSLAAMGIDTRRDAGGYDRGTGVGDWAGFGTVMGGGGNYAVGDILIWPGSHVAIYAGGGQVVHGGWLGNQTVVNGHISLLGMGSPSTVVRPG